MRAKGNLLRESMYLIERNADVIHLCQDCGRVEICSSICRPPYTAVDLTYEIVEALVLQRKASITP